MNGSLRAYRGEEFHAFYILPNPSKEGIICLMWFLGHVVFLGGLGNEMKRDFLGFPLCSWNSASPQLTRVLEIESNIGSGQSL